MKPIESVGTRKLHGTKWTRRTLGISIAVALALGALVALAGCSFLQDGKVEEVKSQAFKVTLSGVAPGESSNTFGEYVEKHAPDGKWSSGTSTSGIGLVEYEGESSDGDVHIQWIEGDNGWSVNAMELDGAAMPLFYVNTWFSR